MFRKYIARLSLVMSLDNNTLREPR